MQPWLGEHKGFLSKTLKKVVNPKHMNRDKPLHLAYIVTEGRQGSVKKIDFILDKSSVFNSLSNRMCLSFLYIGPIYASLPVG